MNHLLIPTKLIRVKRRSIALIVNNKGEFIVRAPLRAKDSEIWAFIAKKQDWIIEKRTKAQTNAIKFKLDLADDQIFNMFGKQYVVKLECCKTAKIIDEKLILPVNEPKKFLINLLKRELKKYLVKRVEEIATIYQFEYKSISITSARTSWGSCGGRNTLNFSFNLAMCPLPVIDYIIVHELCHTKIKNHSAKFWNMVKQIMPEYKVCEKWLKDNRAIVNYI